MQSNPVVKWVRKKAGGHVNFFRVDIGTPAAKEVMQKYNITLNSAYLIFDPQGKEIWRSYAIPLNGRKALRILGVWLKRG
ncbi:MAG: hypothetical protein ACE5NG_04835 [bacterium]